nr:uncharacterized protein LOC123745882 isoform X2 [Procambarus clarkii]
MLEARRGTFLLLVLLFLLTQGDGVLGVRNCLLARSLCTDDASCRSVLEIIPRVCGPESVACSTVTVNKCLAALRTIQAFPYFQPTCLCREPHLDRECNIFREFIFDHPCIFVENKEESPYAVHALPLCEYALNACEQLPGCIQLYEEFRDACRVRDDQCKVVDTNKCLSSWSKLKMSPMFGCICPTDRQKRKCERIFRRVHNNPCVVNVIPYDNSSLHAVDTQIQNPLMESGPGGGRRENASRAADVLGSDRRYLTDPNASHATSPSGSVPVLHSTCQTALTGCITEPTCRRLLDPVLAMCDNECNREACMSNLVTFYRNVESKWALEVAFCLCKKSSLTANECLIAQEKLHPSCARKTAGPVPMRCNRLAAACKEDIGCRHRLEFYEQACAVDSDTRRCAGSTAECRRAVLGILGTQLRSLCTCSASDPRETYICMDWQRILWFNPCVVESQTDYHREMLAALGPGEVVTTTANIFYTPIVTMGVPLEPVQNGPDKSPIIGRPGVVIHPPSATTSSSQFTPPYTNSYPRRPPPTPPPTPPTTTTIPTTTLPPKYCEKRHSNDETIDYIEEGWGKRFYKDEECSELCLCHAEEKLACSVLECVEARPCETSYAVYTHAAPAYQASRGECFCYSGSFICVRPPQDNYDVNHGVFLFIGYSKAEELLLRPYTKISLVDAAMDKLGDLVRESSLQLNGSDCRLEIVTHVGENIILQATLEEYEDSRDNMSAVMLHNEKEACEDVVRDVGQKINNHAKEVREDMALSVLILAEVQVHVPPLPASATMVQFCPLLLLLPLAALASHQHVLLAS